MNITQPEIATPSTTDNNIITVERRSPNWFFSLAESKSHEIRRHVCEIHGLAKSAVVHFNNYDDRHQFVRQIETIANDLAAYGRMLEIKARDLEESRDDDMFF